MVFTVFHVFISFLIFTAFRRVEFFSFIIGSILPDIESFYYSLQAIEVCGNNITCLAEYPSHYFLHSFIGIAFLAFLCIFVVEVFRNYFHLTLYSRKVLWVSAFLGGVTHLLADVTVHRGEDSLMLLFPLSQRFSFIFPKAVSFWYAVAFIGFCVFVYMLIKNKLLEMVK
jgi:membrane-bound metal-dependent hydrolase YbcI (DUF457 family)